MRCSIYAFSLSGLSKSCTPTLLSLSVTFCWQWLPRLLLLQLHSQRIDSELSKRPTTPSPRRGFGRAFEDPQTGGMHCYPPQPFLRRTYTPSAVSLRSRACQRSVASSTEHFTYELVSIVMGTPIACNVRARAMSMRSSSSGFSTKSTPGAVRCVRPRRRKCT